MGTREQKIEHFFNHLDTIDDQLHQKKAIIFLDYDGTLTPIVATPDLAVLSEDMLDCIERLAAFYKVSIVSGRATDDVKGKVGVGGIFYAGSHGFEIVEPNGNVQINSQAQEIRTVIDQVYEQLKNKTQDIEGALVEHVKYTISMHYRLVSDDDFPKIEQAVDEVLSEHQNLRKTHGKKVFEIRPKIDWDKGKAVEWILKVLHYDPARHVAVYIGDDTTDEDAFAVIKDNGLGILVAEEERPTKASYSVKNTKEVREALEFFIQVAEKE